MSCVLVKGDTPVLFQWYLNGDEINPSLGIALTNVGRQTSLLIIQSVHAHHAGNYTCTASNSAGDANVTAELKVKGTSQSCT